MAAPEIWGTRSPVPPSGYATVTETIYKTQIQYNKNSAMISFYVLSKYYIHVLFTYK